MPRVRAATFAIISTIVATLLTFPVAKYVVHSRDLLFIAAVIVVSRFAGVTAGLFVSLASAFLFDWFFDSTPHILDFRFGGLLRMSVFVSVSVLVASLEQRRRHAIESQEEANQKLRRALDEIKTLRGILPICTYCKKIRTDFGTWVEVEQYVRKHTEAEFSHGVCPSCYQERFPEIFQRRHGPKPT